MNHYQVYFKGYDDPLLVTATSFAEAEQTALRQERFKEIIRIAIPETPVRP